MKLVLRALLVLGLVTLLHATKKGQAGKGTRRNGMEVGLLLDPSVQPQIASMSSSSIANMSLSPWTYRDTFEESRWPQRISHAECRTSGCLSLQGGGEDAALEAKPIYYQVLVLHRVPKKRKKAGKKYDFRLGTEVIAVGCTCARPNVIPQQ
ncbi:interleukin 17a/f3 [Symphorus nematophorus]